MELWSVPTTISFALTYRGFTTLWALTLYVVHFCKLLRDAQ